MILIDRAMQGPETIDSETLLNLKRAIKACRYTVTKGHFSGAFILRFWDKTMQTICNAEGASCTTAFHLSETAYAAVEEIRRM